MNLKPLFEMQRALDDRIIDEKGLEGQDLLPEKILALQVELGELANEWRGFKFWSGNRSPKPMSQVVHSSKHPMLFEYVDCLHFILSIGLDLGFVDFEIKRTFELTTTNIFLTIFERCSDLDITKEKTQYISLFSNFVALGNMLGFAWDNIEKAYMEKNKINHQRQSSGY